MNRRLVIVSISALMGYILLSFPYLQYLMFGLTWFVAGQNISLFQQDPRVMRTFVLIISPLALFQLYSMIRIFSWVNGILLWGLTAGCLQLAGYLLAPATFDYKHLSHPKK